MDEEKSNVDFAKLNNLLPRYLRVCGRSITNEYVEAKISWLKELLLTSHVHRVRWQLNFVAIPGYITLSKRTLEQLSEHGVFPMDAASGMASVLVSKLLESMQISECTSPSVLDMCCCPGAKLMSLMDILPLESTLVGVDISSRRLEICLSLVNRHLSLLHKANSSDSNTNDTPFPRTLIMQCDATLFSSASTSLVFDSALWLDGVGRKGYRKRKNKSSRREDKKQLAATKDALDNSFRYDSFDVVVVDAQCTHDGSYRHMVYAASATTTKQSTSQYLTDEVVRETCDLQKRLLQRAFEVVCAGGLVIYSTCSDMHQQNEDIVQWLLDSHATAALEPVASVNPIDIAAIVDSAEDMSDDQCLQAADELCTRVSSLASPPGQEGSLTGTVRFNKYSGTSGLFIACIRKTKCE